MRFCAARSDSTSTLPTYIFHSSCTIFGEGRRPTELQCNPDHVFVDRSFRDGFFGFWTSKLYARSVGVFRAVMSLVGRCAFQITYMRIRLYENRVWGARFGARKPRVQGTDRRRHICRSLRILFVFYIPDDVDFESFSYLQTPSRTEIRKRTPRGAIVISFCRWG